MSNELTPIELEQARQLSYIHPNMYVYYNDYGNILSISNVKDSSKEYLEVPEEKLADFLSGKKDFGRYKIDYFKFNYENTLKDEPSIDTTNNLIYNIPLVHNDSIKDLLVIFDNTKKTWEFVLSDNGVKTVQQNAIDKIYSFFVTLNRDPHFLVETLQIAGSDLINGTVINCNHVPLVPSMTTMKQFNSYGLIIR